jgi:hypothetical protein
MKAALRSRSSFAAVLLAAAALCALFGLRVRAQESCPEPSVLVLRPTNGASGLSGKIRVDASFPASAPAGYQWGGDYYIDVLNQSGGLVERIAMSGGAGGRWAVFDSRLHLRRANGGLIPASSWKG